MSKTDKTRPYRVREYTEGVIEHDHRSGRCVVETRDDALSPTYAWKRYAHDCPRRELVEVSCPGYCYAEDGEHIWYGNSSPCRWARDIFREYEGVRGRPLSGPAFRALERARRRRFYCDVPHHRTVFHPERRCDACDSRPTCEYGLPHNGAITWHSPPPRWFRNKFHRIERRNERDVLRDAMRDYNANGDTEIEPGRVFHQHCAWWYWA